MSGGRAIVVSERVDSPPVERDLNGDERVVAERGHGLQVGGDAGIGLAVGFGPKAARNLDFHLGHAQSSLACIVGETHVGIVQEAQHGGFVLDEPLVQVVGIGFGDPSALALAAWRDGRQFLGTLGQDGAVALAQGLAGGCAQDLGLADWRALAAAVNLSEDAAAGKAVGILLQRYHAAPDDRRCVGPPPPGDRKSKLEWIIDQLGEGDLDAARSGVAGARALFRPACPSG